MTNVYLQTLLNRRGFALSSASRAEAREIASETEPELFWAECLRLGLQLEAAGRTEEAVLWYRESLDSLRPPPETRERLRQRLAALGGKGRFGEQFESFARRFPRQATDYRVLVPMMLAGMAGQVAKSWVLNRLAARAAWRGAPSAWAAAATSLAVETPIFSLGHKSLRAFSGEAQDWNVEALGSDFRASTMSLAALKVGAWTAQGTLQSLFKTNYYGIPQRGARYFAWLRSGMPWLATVSGLALARGMESGLGWREGLGAGQILALSLEETFAFGIGARLGAAALGPSWSGFVAELEARTSAPRPIPRPPNPTRRAAMEICPPFHEFTVGGHPLAESYLPTAAIGEEFAEIWRRGMLSFLEEGNRWKLSKAGSRDFSDDPEALPVWVNGHFMSAEKVELKDGDLVQAGRAWLRFKVPELEGRPWPRGSGQGELLGVQLLRSPPHFALLSRFLGRGDVSAMSDDAILARIEAMAGPELFRATRGLFERREASWYSEMRSFVSRDLAGKSPDVEDYYLSLLKFLQGDSEKTVLGMFGDRSHEWSNAAAAGQVGGDVLHRFNLFLDLLFQVKIQGLPDELVLQGVPVVGGNPTVLPRGVSEWYFGGRFQENSLFEHEAMLGDLRRHGVLRFDKDVFGNRFHFLPYPGSALPETSFQTIARIGDVDYRVSSRPSFKSGRKWTEYRFAPREPEVSEFKEFRILFPEGAADLPFLVKFLRKYQMRRTEAADREYDLSALLTMQAIEDPAWVRLHRLEVFLRPQMQEILQKTRLLRDAPRYHAEIEGEFLPQRWTVQIPVKTRYEILKLLSRGSSLEVWLRKMGFVASGEEKAIQDGATVGWEWRGRRTDGDELVLKIFAEKPFDPEKLKFPSR